MAHNPHEVRISVAGLGLRMYVSRLDRPWLETPFLLEGLLVDSQDDLAKLKAVCQFVYVDVTRGARPDARFIEPDAPDPAKQGGPRNDIASLNTTVWAVSAPFEAELPKAEKVHKTLETGIEEMMSDLHGGRELDMQKLKEGVEAMIDSVTRNPSAFVWLKAIKKKSNYAYQHALGSSVWAASFGRHLGLSRDELGDLAFAGLLFDVGKTLIPEELLEKPGPFTPEEHAQMRQHVQAGIEILERTPGVPPRTIQAVATHHERHDGSGYPHGLQGSQIPIFGRIIGLIDSYDAMTSNRPYAAGRSPHQAVMELYHSRDRMFQADLVEQFIQTCGVYPSGSLVELSDGRVGVVTAVHDLKRLRPRIMILLDANKAPMPEFHSIDMSVVLNDAQGQPLNIKRGLPEGAFGIDPAELFLD